MRYFFHIRDGEDLILDQEGSDCASLAAAIEEAKADARELMAERLRSGRELDGQSFEIVDDAGLLAAVVRFKDALPL
ncbi:hypothetical protein FHX08_005212 [Rhizobium sp. BK529]|uniref:DUF6894 family protein n=1 Tax=unclassified Rhizobium TaxID=2613769 RepID=UPI001052B25B|nr:MULTISPECIES: hypothetical protein [unclassified Rhizobium]MBB3594802.1 hypothetical protein [Rhizobium sp. BK529]TCR97885.1 hypothetical protein EV281_110104 [Rhizobium sp. BK418]